MYSFAAAPDAVSLPTGATISLSMVTYDGASFRYGLLDVTPFLSQLQKNQVPGYSIDAGLIVSSNARYLAAGKAPPKPGSTSTAVNFLTNLADSLDISKPGSQVRSLANYGLLFGALALVGLYIYTKKK